MLDQQQFKAFGIMPAEKIRSWRSSPCSTSAPRSALIAGHVIVCDGGTPLHARYERRTYVGVARPIFPLDRSLEL